MQKENSLENFKKEYEKIRKKYSLPKFEEINKEFEIERRAEETTFIVREVRRAIIEKISFILKFLESIINPSSSPYLLVIFSSSLKEDEKKILNKLYLKLGQFYIESISLENNSDEKKEIEFIKKVLKEWEDIKKDFDFILNKSFMTQKTKKEKNYIC